MKIGYAAMAKLLLSFLSMSLRSFLHSYLVGVLRSFSPKPFKFYNYWIDHQDFLNWVKEGWRQQVDGVPMYQLCKKL
jgi:hypothetical protein